MKPAFSIIVPFLFVIFSHAQQVDNLAFGEFGRESNVKSVDNDSLQCFRIINNSSLKKLPRVVKDLLLVLNEPGSAMKSFLGKKGVTIYLHDVNCKTFEISAKVLNTFSDTIFHVEINKFNQLAEDKALAATLIHETMHCLLMNIYRREINGDDSALEAIKSFGLYKDDSTSFFNNDFLFLMNDGESGSHELMYRLFYPQMISLLNRFAKIHKQNLGYNEAEFLMWSGLQKTEAYQKLSEERRSDIELTILTAKGIKAGWN